MHLIILEKNIGDLNDSKKVLVWNEVGQEEKKYVWSPAQGHTWKILSPERVFSSESQPASSVHTRYLGFHAPTRYRCFDINTFSFSSPSNIISFLKSPH